MDWDWSDSVSASTLAVSAGAHTISQASFIEGISWEIGPQSWETVWNLSSTLPQVGQWELGTVGLSELGVTTSLVSTI